MKKATLNKAFLLVLTLALILAALVLTACNGTEGGTKDPEGSTSSTTEDPNNTDNIAPHTHAFEDWKIIKEATCTEDGTKEAACSCGEKKTETIPAKGHTFGEWTTVKEATCTESGTKEAVCACGKKKTEIIPAEGHNFVNKICDKCGELKPSEGLNYISNSGEQSYSVSGIGSCTDTDIVIPSTYNGEPVTKIGAKAFSNCTKLTSITIPDSVTRIDYSAFEGCTGLTSITIPDSVTSIGNRTFRGCTGLTSITIPDSVTFIGNSAFYNTAYYNNESNWVDGVLYIGNYLINAKASVSGSYTIKAGTICIANYAFIDGDYYCTDLTSITIPDSVTSIGGSAFRNCTGLTSITIPNGVTSIRDSAFSGCTGLTSITVPDSVEKIGASAFYNTAYYNNESNWVDGVLYIGNHLIEAKNTISGSYTIKSGTKCIANDAFRNCTGLTSITIPNSVISIGSYAFSRCTGLKAVYITDIAKWCEISFGGIEANPFSYAHDLYLNETLVTDLVIPDGVTSIGNRAFLGCTGLTSITIPGSVTSIGEYAFTGCKGLTSITIPDSVTSIGYGLLSGCSSIESITLPFVPGTNSTYFGYIFGASFFEIKPDIPVSLKKVVITKGTKIGAATFYKFAGLTSITIPDSVTSIGNNAFYGCTGLTSITIPNSVTSIGNDAFYGCKGLTSITIPDSVTSIGERAFSSCTSLTSITIGNEVTSIGHGAFLNCSGLTSITVSNGNTVYHSEGNCLIDTKNKVLIAGCKTSVIPTDGSVTSIGDAAFTGCTGLKSITIPDGVTNIGIGVFNDCTDLESITIPSSVTNIDIMAFYGCTGLTSISFNGTKEQWNAVKKLDGWNIKTGSYTVHCTDGDIKK